MAFALELQNSLLNRTARVPSEIEAGHSLEEVLSKHLLAVEAVANTDLLTSILLLDSDGKRLCHAAAPSLPHSYCEAINGVEIGATAGSCGTAAFKNQAVYVTDIATDALWSNFRHLALPHGLRACWSTPIHNNQGVLVGTFAIYHSVPRSPTREEVNAISLVTDHVARAIDLFCDVQDLSEFTVGNVSIRSAPPSSSGLNNDPGGGPEARYIVRSIESDFGKLARIIERAIEAGSDANSQALRRAKRAAERGAEIARKIMEPE